MFTHSQLIFAAAAAPKGAADKGGEDVFPIFDPSYFASQIFWLLLTFFTLYFLLGRFLLPRVGNVIAARSDRIADDLDMASQLQREAVEAEKDYEQKLADARAKAHNIAATTKSSVESEIAQEIQAADEESARQAAAAETKIAEIRASALSNIDNVASEIASEIVDKLSSIKASPSTILKRL